MFRPTRPSPCAIKLFWLKLLYFIHCRNIPLKFYNSITNVDVFIFRKQCRCIFVTFRILKLLVHVEWKMETNTWKNAVQQDNEIHYETERC
jgi:hypothetical protein